MAKTKQKPQPVDLDLRSLMQFRAEHALPMALSSDPMEENGTCLPDGFTVEPGENATDVYCYCPIGGYIDWDGKPTGISAAAFAREWRKVEAAGKPARCYFNTPGGDVFDGAAIFNILSRSKVSVEGYVDGTALSISSMILMACDNVYMAETSWLMLHNPWSITVGNAADHEKTIATLNTLKTGMCAAYCKKSGMKADAMDQVMSAETWMTAAQAKEMGLCDEIVAPKNVQAHCDLKQFAACYQNTPKDVYQFFNAAPNVREPRNTKPPVNGDKQEIETMAEKPSITFEALRTDYPEVYAKVREESVKAERERIQQIRAAAFDGQDALVDKLIADGTEIAPSVLALNQAFKAAGAKAIEDKIAETNGTVIPPTPPAQPKAKAKEPEPTEAQLLDQWTRHFLAQGHGEEKAKRMARNAIEA